MKLLLRGSVLFNIAVALAFIQARPASAQSSPPPNEVTFPSNDRLLHGFLYKPDGPGPFPAILWNHGSERRPGWLPELAPLFLAKGYVLFVPHRPGHGRSPGDYVMDVLAQASASGGRDARDKKLIEVMEAQLEDQAAALTFLKQLDYVDAKRIAVAGCSFGGIQTVLIAERGLGIRAAVDFAGAAQTWREAPRLRERLLKAVRQAQMPILFIQAKNDYDLAPSRELAAQMEKADKPHALQIFPSFGKTNQEAHEFCAHGGEIWASQVFSFLTEAMH